MQRPTETQVCTSILYIPIFPSKEDVDITPGILGHQWTSKFQFVPDGNSQTIFAKIIITKNSVTIKFVNKEYNQWVMIKSVKQKLKWKKEDQTPPLQKPCPSI